MGVANVAYLSASGGYGKRDQGNHQGIERFHGVISYLGLPDVSILQRKPFLVGNVLSMTSGCG